MLFNGCEEHQNQNFPVAINVHTCKNRWPPQHSHTYDLSDNDSCESFGHYLERDKSSKNNRANLVATQCFIL